MSSWGTTLWVAVALIVANAFWGGSSIASKIGLERMSVLTLSMYRQLFATPLLMLITWALERPLRLPVRSDFPSIILCGLFGVFFNQVLFAVGVYWTGAVIASIMQLAVSPITAFVEIVFGMAKFSWCKAAGMLLCIVGSLIMIGIHNAASMETKKMWGVGVLFLQGCFAAGYLIIQKRLLERLTPITATTAMYIPGTVFTVLTSVIVLSITGDSWTPGDGIGWLCIGYAVIFQSVAAYILNAWANAKSSPSTVAVFETINPLFAAVFSPMFGMTEGLDKWNTWIGAVIVILGLAVVTWQHHRQLAQQKQKEENEVHSTPMDALQLEETDAATVELDMNSTRHSNVIVLRDPDESVQHEEPRAV